MYMLSRTHARAFGALVHARSARSASGARWATTAGRGAEEVLDVVVVGAGISGLSTAQSLVSRRPQVRLLVAEAEDRVGGSLCTVKKGGYVWERGPNSVAPTPGILRAVADAGLHPKDLIYADPSAPRWVYWSGRLHAVPRSLKGSFSLFSVRGWARILWGVAGLRSWMTHAADKKNAVEAGEESVEAWTTRVLGKEALQKLVEPFCSGVYAGDVARLSMQAALPRVQSMESSGGLLRGALAAMWKSSKAKKKGGHQAGHAPAVAVPPAPRGATVSSLAGGLDRLPEAMRVKLGDAVKLGWRLEQLERCQTGRYRLRFSTSRGSQTLWARSVVVATHGASAPALLRSACPRASRALEAIPYVPIALCAVSYPTSCMSPGRGDAAWQRSNAGPLRHPGFGELHPRGQGLRSLGVIYASALFAGVDARAPRGWGTFVAFFGGAHDPGAVRLSDEALADELHRDLLRGVLSRSACDAEGRTRGTILGVRRWEQGIPQYNLGHAEVRRTVQEALAETPGLFLAGNQLTGVAVGNCVDAGYALGERLDAFLSGLREE